MAEVRPCVYEPVFLTNGWKLTMPFTNLAPQNSIKGVRIYWRRGITPAVYAWMLDQIGEPCKVNSDWDSTNEGRWIYIGSVVLPMTGGRQHAVSLRFREKTDAMLFKLRWMHEL